MTRIVALLAVVAAVCACSGTSGRADDQRDLSAYTGLATWVDLYDPHVLARPEASVAAMAKQGVRTLFLETSNYQMRQDVVRPDRVGRFVEAAHARGLQILAWYLPSFRNLALDKRRALAAIDFVSLDGEGFDSFALDIESSVVRSPAVRNTRLLLLSRRIRAAAPGWTLGAIVPSPRGLQLLPKYWPAFPAAQLALTFDVFLPMGYFTYREHLPGGSATYTSRNLALLRQWTGNPDLPIHAIGGLAEAATPAQVRAFVRAAGVGGAIGSSLYDFSTTSASQWRELQAANGVAPVATG